jgi:hypothetical protein
MGPKIFTVREASACIPQLEAGFKTLDDVRHRLKKLKGKVDVLEMLWGDEIQADSNPDHREHGHYLEEMEKLKQEYEAATRRFVEMEVVLKSVEQGLIDFYGVVDSRLVFLCWKRGEKEIEYFHHLEDGFAGRQTLPSAKA